MAKFLKILVLLGTLFGGVHAEARTSLIGEEMKLEGSVISNVPAFEADTKAADLRTVPAGSDQHAVISHSFTDQFLEFLRQRQQAVDAANQIAAEEDEMEDEDWEEELQGGRTEGDVTILQNLGGERHWRFFRPDPFRLGRSTTIQVHVQAHHTLQDVELQVVQHWPDLRNPATRWKLHLVHRSIESSIYLEEGHEAFIVEVNRDLQFGQVPIMFEYQYWDVGQNRFYGILEPRVHSGVMRGISLMFRDVVGHECHARPCFSNLNGSPLESYEEYTVECGDYVVVSGISTSRETTRILGYWSPYGTVQEIPLTLAFARAVGQEMMTEQISFERCQANAALLQRNMVKTYHDLYRATKSEQLRRGTILMIAPADGYDPQEVHPVRMTEVQWGTRPSFEFPLLMEALVEANMMEHSWDGVFALPHHTVYVLTLPVTLNQLDQVMLIRPPHEIIQEVALLAEFRVEGTPQEQERYGQFEMVMIFVNTPTTLDGLLRALHLDQECAEHDCLVSLNERVLRDDHQPLHVADGDIVRVWYSVPQRTEENVGMEGAESYIPPNQETGGIYQAQAATMTRTLTPSSGSMANSDQHSSSRTCSTAIAANAEGRTPPYVPGTLHFNLLWMCWLFRMVKLFAQKLVKRVMGPKRKGKPDVRADSKRKESLNKQCKTPIGMLSFLLVLGGSVTLALAGTERFGEALHPGPSFWLGTTNPSGVAGKERQLAEVPPGIWGVTETHLSGVTQKASIRRIGQIGREQGRELYCVPGAPLPLRARSTSAGIWSGVMTLTDWISKPIACHWEHGEYGLGRVQVVQSFYGPTSVLGATIYGWPTSPTWPHALRDTNVLFDNVVREVGLSRGGPRYIMGDFNHDLALLRGWEVLQRAGWKDAQELAYELWGQECLMTFREASITDHVLLSPEMVPMVTKVQGWKWFADHLGLGVCVEIPLMKMQQWVWPLPADIPWDSVRYEEWRQAHHTLPSQEGQWIDHRIDLWARSYENSFDGYMDTAIGTLPTSCRGRCQQSGGQMREADCPLMKPSRPGEVQIKTDFVGRAVQRWFQQLRRIQSMVHATKAGKNTPDAIEYRASLWRAIRLAKGFDGTFEKWWKTRPTQYAGLDNEFPTEPPSAAFCQAIFDDFLLNYRKFEAWHTRQRRNLLMAQYEANTNKIFEVTRKEPKGGINLLEKVTNTTILGIHDELPQIHVDVKKEISLPATLQVMDATIPILGQDEQILTLDGEWLLQPGQGCTIVEHANTVPQIHQQLIEFWKPRWWKEPLPQPAEWDRIVNFAKAYLPPGKLCHSDITVETWENINKRYGPRAARGPDGIGHHDLRKMPQAWKSEIVGILNQCERETYWPPVWRTGFVHSLAKKEGAAQVNEFRPVIIYSMIYRSWGSLRAQRFLRFLSSLADEKQLGFMPGCEVAEVWMLMQGLIEKNVQQGEDLMGFVTDIRKAFESLPRDPIFAIALHLGLPEQTIMLWKFFLENTERRFLVRGEISAAVFSNYGFPEGCSLSCVAMSIAGLTLHSYMKEFSRLCSTISYVDNLELLAGSIGGLQHGVLTMQVWTEMWKLDLDEEKSYIWTTEAETRKEARVLGWDVTRSAKDLGAQLNYGKSNSIRVQTQRFESLAPIWMKLKRCLASSWQKQRLLRQAIWPKAFYGVSVCSLGWTHLKALRTEAMKALGFRMAGAAPGLRLGLLCHEQCDPGFYQVWVVLTTFRRVARKRPLFIQVWKEYMDNYRGCSKQGPFAKMLEICNQLRWTIGVPLLADSDGVWHAWLEMHEKTLYELVKDAWIQHICREVQHRKDLAGIDGIDHRVVQQARKKVKPYLLGLISRLQDGTFVEPRQHAKYDTGKDSKCGLCGGHDSVEHRCTTCPARATIYLEHNHILQKWESFSRAKKIHLLPPRNPHWINFKEAVCKEVDRERRGPKRPEPEQCHLFTDGSCHGNRHRMYHLASWAVVSASGDFCVASGVLGGLGQDSDRAELRALIAAVNYALEIQRDTTIWTDSTFAAEGMVRLLHDIRDVPDGNYDNDWLELQGLLCQREMSLQVQHVPGHCP